MRARKCHNHQQARTSVGVLVDDVPGPRLAQGAVPLHHKGGHPDGVPRGDGVPLVRQAVDALPLQEEQAVLVVVDLLHQQILPRLKVHDVHVEVVLRGGGQQLAQGENLGGDGDERLRIRLPKQQLRPGAIHQGGHRAARLDVPLLVHQHNSAALQAGQAAHRMAGQQSADHIPGPWHAPVGLRRREVREVVLLEGALLRARSDEHRALHHHRKSGTLESAMMCGDAAQTAQMDCTVQPQAKARRTSSSRLGGRKSGVAPDGRWEGRRRAQVDDRHSEVRASRLGRHQHRARGVAPETRGVRDAAAGGGGSGLSQPHQPKRPAYTRLSGVMSAWSV